MKHLNSFIYILSTLVIMTGCSSYNPLDDYEELIPVTILNGPEASDITSYPPETVEKGQYLVELLGCGTCHTDGALIGEPNANRGLAGSSTGIAYSNPLVQALPGVVYPANLTPDPETGKARR